MNAREREAVRELAKRVLDAVHTSENLALIKRYEDINALIPQVPPVAVVLPPQAERTLLFPKEYHTQDGWLQALEQTLHARLVRRSALGDDQPVSEILYSGFSYEVSDWKEGHRSVRVDEDNRSSTRFEPCIHTPEDYYTLRAPVLTFDEAQTNRDYGRLADLLGDILPVVRGKPYAGACGWGESLIDHLVEMRGLEAFYYDTIDCPEAIHAAMAFMMDAYLRLLEDFAAHGMLVANNGVNILGSSCFGLYAGFGAAARGVVASEKELWGFAQAQELSAVSADMLEEFVLPYQAQIVNRFGLSLYGCCEAIEHKIASVEKYIHNLRMISISPFTDPQAAGALCRGKYVYAWKTQPTYVSCFDEAALRGEFRETLRHTGGCSMTVNLRDVFDYGVVPERFIQYVKIAKEEIAKYYC